jgi:hypothetical protein
MAPGSIFITTFAPAKTSIRINVYPEDLPYLQQQLKPLKTYPVEMRVSEIWVDLD